MCADSGRPSTDSNFLAFYENLGSMAQDDPGRHWGFEEQDFDPDPITGSKQRVDPDPDKDLPTDKDGRVLEALNNVSNFLWFVESPTGSHLPLMAAVRQFKTHAHIIC